MLAPDILAEAPEAVPAAESRRTFAIISHPDAGKTTLTEKLLLAGGAIRLAGHVKARGERRRTRSDWMAIEQARGISVTSSVMTFEHRGLTFNLLDTPGHSDFSEDTYRTLTAVDAAVMVIDAAKGIESQTRKLFEVCRLRDIPILTFVNKVDREGQDPLALLDEIADTLALELTPASWPIGMGTDFRGCLDLVGDRLLLPADGRGTAFGRTMPLANPEDAIEAGEIEDRILEPALENLELARSALPAFDMASFREGHLSPVFFGSALKEFCVPELLAGLASWAPPPRPQRTATREVDPNEGAVTGFVFKVQANMDPNHRDRVAFVRLCSGRFRRGMKLHHVRTGRALTVANPTFFFAQERETAEEALPGDILGIPNHGTLNVGDTLTEGENLKFVGIPNFAPEILRRVRLGDPSKAKQLQRALDDLAAEGVTHVFRPLLGAQWILGVVGPLQLDVLASRISAEYGVAMELEAAPFETARWVVADDPAQLKAFVEANRSAVAEDRDGQPVFLARNSWVLNRAKEDWPKIRFSDTRERG